MPARGDSGGSPVIRSFGERRLQLVWSQNLSAGRRPDDSVSTLLDQAAADGPEQPATGRGGVRLGVLPQQLDQLGRDRDGPGGVLGVVLQSSGDRARCRCRSVLRPTRGRGTVDRVPSLLRAEGLIVTRQGSGSVVRERTSRPVGLWPTLKRPLSSSR